MDKEVSPIRKYFTVRSSHPLSVRFDAGRSRLLVRDFLMDRFSPTSEVTSTASGSTVHCRHGMVIQVCKGIALYRATTPVRPAMERAHGTSRGRPFRERQLSYTVRSGVSGNVRHEGPARSPASWDILA